MRTFLVSSLIVVIAPVTSVCRAADKSELERAIRELPPRFVADIPLSQRFHLLESLRRDFSNPRLDIRREYFHLYSDKSRKGIGATSMLYMRQFRRADGSFVVFTHMPKPFAGGSAPPSANQTFVFERLGDTWIDVTAKILPSDLDLTTHLRPQREAPVITVFPYCRKKRQDGRGETWDFGSPTVELHWDGHGFQTHVPAKTSPLDE